MACRMHVGRWASAAVGTNGANAITIGYRITLQGARLYVHVSGFLKRHMLHLGIANKAKHLEGCLCIGLWAADDDHIS
jgi:hypothetical protein